MKLKETDGSENRFGQYTAYTVRDFYSHAPCGARPQNLVIHLAATSIS